MSRNYVLDTNAVSDLLRNNQRVWLQFREAIRRGDQIFLCPAVYYEVTRGLLHANAIAQQSRFEQELLPLLAWVYIFTSDWHNAAVMWADMVRQRRQFADVDLLVAAVADRLGAVIVSSDDDFHALTVERENWRA